MKNLDNKVTIREVAARAGVSVMTVSRVLRKDPNVAKDTRANVERMIEELGYEPLHFARNLSSGVPRVLGIAVPPLSVRAQIRAGYEYFAAVHLGALQACVEHDYSLVLFQVEEERSADVFLRKVRSRQMAGFIVEAPATEVPGLLDALNDHDIRFAAINPLRADACELAATSQDRLAIRQLVERMQAHGHRKIGFIGGGSDIRARTERVAGYLDAMQAAGARDADIEVIDTPDLSFEDGLEAGRRILAKRRAPTAFQCVNDAVAAGFMVATQERDIRLPEHTSLAGFDDFPLAAHLFPRLTTARQPVEELAASAARLLIRKLEGQDGQPHVELACPLVERDSIAEVRRQV